VISGHNSIAISKRIIFISFFLVTFPRGIEPLSLQYRAVPSYDFPVPGETCPINPTVPGEVHECWFIPILTVTQ
jgi:hypothetical protein